MVELGNVFLTLTNLPLLKEYCKFNTSEVSIIALYY